MGTSHNNTDWTECRSFAMGPPRILTGSKLSIITVGVHSRVGRLLVRGGGKFGIRTARQTEKRHEHESGRGREVPSLEIMMKMSVIT